MPRLSKPEKCEQCPYRWKYLDSLSVENIESIQKSCIIINFKKGETVVKQGTDVTHSLYLAKGSVKLFIEGKKNLILKLIKQGNYIDLSAIFGDRLYKYSVTALEDSMICMTPADTIINLAKTNNAYLFELTKSISTSSNYIYNKISDLSRKQLRGRLADTILYLAENIYEADEFDILLTRNELAEFSSMSMENAVRILTEFRKDKIISLKGRRIKILEPELLKRISEIS